MMTKTEFRGGNPFFREHELRDAIYAVLNLDKANWIPIYQEFSDPISNEPASAYVHLPNKFIVS